LAESESPLLLVLGLGFWSLTLLQASLLETKSMYPLLRKTAVSYRDF
jgi:hypothetical protein